jgi:hypothetical protein
MGKRVVVREKDFSVTSLATTPFYSRACICKCLMSPGIDFQGIDSKECRRQAGTSNRIVDRPARLGIDFLGPLKCI